VIGLPLLLGLVSLAAALITGALGYGYSSITVPIALLAISSKRLNPALVIVETMVNGYAAIMYRRSIRAIWPHVAPVVIGVIPGVVAGALLLASLPVGTIKLVCYSALLPLILIQAAGLRIAIRHTRAVGVPFGVAVGVLYSMTTISGPPLALFFNNQGLAKEDFKVALALTRTIESVLTLAAYAWLGLLTWDAAELTGYLVPGVLIGMPLGHALIRRFAPEIFRRVCMSFDAWLVGFGLSRLVDDAIALPPGVSYVVLAVTIVVDAMLLRSFFRQRAAASSNPSRTRPAVSTSIQRR
jgi:hypothetical protein